MQRLRFRSMAASRWGRALQRTAPLALTILLALGACDGRPSAVEPERPDPPTDPSLSIVQARNGFYDIAARSGGFGESNPGVYDVATDTDHPRSIARGFDVAVLAGLNRNFNTFRSYTTETDYVQQTGRTRSSPFSVVVLDPNLTEFTDSFERLGTTGLRVTYTLPGPPETPDALTIQQDLIVHGEDFEGSSVEVTTRVTNDGAAAVRIGARYFWDWQLDRDAAPTFHARSPDGSPTTTEATFASPAFSHYLMEGIHSSGEPEYNMFGSVGGPSTLSPAPTAPELLQVVDANLAQSTAFEYSTSPSRTPSDNGALYTWGATSVSAIELAPGATAVFSQSMFSAENFAPTAAITAPAANSTFTQGEEIDFAGSATDPEDGDLTGSALVWSSSRDGQIGTGTSFSRSDLSVGSHSIILTATDSDGNPNSTSITVTIEPPADNEPPAAEITSPEDGDEFTEGDEIDFAGTGTDPEDGDLTGSALVWRSSSDGEIGTGTSFSVSDLSVGTHTITLTATDSEDLTGTASVTITVDEEDVPPPPDTLQIEIDILPGVEPNETGLEVLVPVAILSSATFDARQIDPATLTLGIGGPGGAVLTLDAEKNPHVLHQDVNGDGILDLFVAFCPLSGVEGISEETTALLLEGRLLDGRSIRGSDAVVIVD